MLDDGRKLKPHWIVTLKATGPFGRDAVLRCYKLRRVKDDGVVVSGSSVPFYEEYNGEDIFIPAKDICTIEKVLTMEKVVYSGYEDKKKGLLRRCLERMNSYGDVL